MLNVHYKTWKFISSVISTNLHRTKFIMTNLMHMFLIYLSIYFCLTCFGISFSPSSEVGVQLRQWFKCAGYGVSAPWRWHHTQHTVHYVGHYTVPSACMLGSSPNSVAYRRILRPQDSRGCIIMPVASATLHIACLRSIFAAHQQSFATEADEAQ
jgi:hypothetical protein